jgi:hypothetical protein
MKKYLLILLLSFGCTGLWSQTSKIATPQQTSVTNITRYKIDYEIKDVATPTSTLLESLDLAQYEAQRQDATDIEILDANHGVTIILYSNNKAGMNKRNARPTTEPNQNEHHE